MYFYIIHTVYILTINIYITLSDMIHITLYLNEIPSGHTAWRWVFICKFLTELKQLQTFVWNCSLFQILTDNQPLLSIFVNCKCIPVHSASRLQCWAATLLGYDFRIECTKQKDFGKADTLSRLILSHSAPDEEVVVAALPAGSTWTCRPVTFPWSSINSARLPRWMYCYNQWRNSSSLADQTSDFSASTPTGHIKRGSTDAGVAHNRARFYSVQGTCGYHDRTADQSSQSPSPRTSGDPTNEVTRGNSAYWPGMEHDIEEMVRLRGTCAEAAKQPVKATLQSRPPATKPWKRIHIDLAGPHLGRQFVIVVNSYLKYTDVISVSSTTSRQTLGILRKLCAQHGVVEKIVSDNGMQFTSHEFRDLSNANAISHILSPP